MKEINLDQSPILVISLMILYVFNLKLKATANGKSAHMLKIWHMLILYI